MLLRRIARPLLAGVFISGGIAQLRDAEGHAKAASPVLDKVAGLAPTAQPPSNVTLVRADASIKVGAGLLLALGKAPRLSAAALATSLVPTTLAEHRFWEMRDPEQRKAHQIHFVKNLGLLGGLLLASADTAGKPSVAWRARRVGRTSAATAQLLHRDITAGLGELTERVGGASGVASDAAGRLGEHAAEAAGRLGEQAAEVAGRVGGQASGVAGRLGEQASGAAARFGEQASGVAGRFGEQASGAAGRFGEQASGVAGHATGRAAVVAGKVGERLTEQTERLLDEAERLRGVAEKRTARMAKRARKASKRASRRASSRIDQVNRRAENRIKQASKRAEKMRATLPKQASKEAGRRARRLREAVPAALVSH
jgi:uncharacterized membrane protein YphA (DoxX/SURF4 family)